MRLRHRGSRNCNRESCATIHRSGKNAFSALCRKTDSAVFAIKFCRGDENSFKTPPIRRRRMARLCLCVPGLNYCHKRAFRKLQIAKVNKFRNKTSTIFQETVSAFYFFSGKRRQNSCKITGVLFCTSLLETHLFVSFYIDNILFS